MLSQNPLKLLDISYFWNEQRHLVLVKSTSRISFLLHPLDGSGWLCGHSDDIFQIKFHNTCWEGVCLYGNIFFIKRKKLKLTHYFFSTKNNKKDKFYSMQTCKINFLWGHQKQKRRGLDISSNCFMILLQKENKICCCWISHLLLRWYC